MPATQPAPKPVRAAVLGERGVFTWQRALHVTGRTLPEAVRYTLAVLALYMDPDGTNGRPGLARLAEARGKSERTIRTHLERAVEAGWLVCVRRGGRDGNGQSWASVYAAVFPAEVFASLGELLSPAWGDPSCQPQPAAPGLPVELVPTGNPYASTGSPAVSTGSPALPPTDPSHRPVTPISQSAQDAEAARWLHGRYGLTDAEAALVIAEARRRAGRVIRSLVPYLERMAVDEHGNPSRDLADVVEAVQLAARPAEPEAPAGGRESAAVAPAPASATGCGHGAPAPDGGGCVVCQTTQARRARRAAAAEAVPAPLVAVVPAAQARDDAHRKFCRVPRCSRCVGIRAAQQVSA